MTRSLAALFAAALLLPTVSTAPARADDKDKDAAAVLDKAIKALGGEEKLAKAAGYSWKTKSVITINGNDNEMTGQSTVKGFDHFHSEISGNFGGNDFKMVMVLAGDKGWRKFNDQLMPLDGDGLANDKRTAYLQAAAFTILPLKGKEFKVVSAGEEKVGDKPAAVLKVTGPDGKDFKLWFDKETGLLVKELARVAGFMPGEEFDRETTYKDYKEFGGIKRATKYEVKRDGEKFIESDVSDVKVLDKVDADTFAEPK